VLTSESEGMPVSLMEAAACGVPVVATRVGGVPELVIDEETGLLVPAGDVAGLATALARVLDDVELKARLGTAARCRAEARFSVTKQVELLLRVWASALAKPSLENSKVSDPYGAAKDKDLSSLVAALDLERAKSEFKRRLPRLSGNTGKLRLKRIRVVRYKPGRRAVVEYDVKVRRLGQEDEKVTLIGKVRARRSGNEGYRLQEAIWNAGFQANSLDGISVPEPVGVIAKYQMWFQRKVKGLTVDRLLAGPEGIVLARRVAEAAHKLHRAGVVTDKRHMMADELRILRGCFDKLAVAIPQLAARLTGVMAACEQVGGAVAEPVACGVHRDFYPAQVIADGKRLWMIDFDLYCMGDPGLDVGNFIGHVTEQAVREQGGADALCGVERELEERFVELSGESVRPAVRAYAMLTLARPIYLSAQFPARRNITERILELCERRLGVV